MTNLISGPPDPGSWRGYSPPSFCKSECTNQVDLHVLFETKTKQIWPIDHVRIETGWICMYSLQWCRYSGFYGFHGTHNFHRLHFYPLFGTCSYIDLEKICLYYQCRTHRFETLTTPLLNICKLWEV